MKNGFLLTVAFLLALTCSGAAQQKLGIVKDKPAKGRFVKIEGGYMVPYEVKIPGTDVKFTMMPIPGGTVLLGSPPNEAKRKSQEGPQVKVTVKPFWMAKNEVTWAEYHRYMELHDLFKSFETHRMRKIEKKHSDAIITAPSNLYDTTFTYVNGEEPELPAVTMSQYAAKQYTKWMSLLTHNFYRLPSEAEWEHACRAGTTTAYHFGNDPALLKEYGWFYDNANDTTHPVGKKKPNPWGLYDMHGNVSEWVLDEYLTSGYTTLAKAQKPLSAADAIVWPKKLFPRVCKGGNWDLDADACRSAARLPSHDDEWRSEDPNIPLSPWWFTSGPSLGVGFRIIRPLDENVKDKERFWKADLKQVKDDVKYRIDEEGRGARGYIDDNLPRAIEEVKKKDMQ